MTFDDPLAYYEEVKSAKKRKKAEHQKSNDMKDNVPELLTVEADGKRAITYQVSCSCIAFHSHNLNDKTKVNTTVIGIRSISNPAVQPLRRMRMEVVPVECRAHQVIKW